MKISNVLVGEEIARTTSDEKGMQNRGDAYSTLIYVCTGQDD